MDLYSAFMRAAAKAIVKKLPGEAEEIQANNADETSWKIFTLKNNHLSKIIQDVHNMGLGSLYYVQFSIIAPLSIENKLPGVGAVVNLALRRSKQNEQSQRWQQAGDELVWLFRLASRTFDKQSDIVAKATANPTEYLRLINWVYKRKTPCGSEDFDSFGIGIRELRKLHSNLQKELEKADLTLRKLLWRKYKALASAQDGSPYHARGEANALLKKRQCTGIDSRDDLNRTATHYVVATRSIGVLEIYLASQYEVNAQDICGRTALHYTSICNDGDPDLIDGLVRRGADLDVRARDGATPLHYAAMAGKEVVVEALVEAGATIDIPDLSGGSPLHTAAVNGHLGVVSYLWGRANKGLRDHSGRTVLHLAAIAGKKEVVEFLFF
jgi:ankyrin repeat protein